MKILKASTLLVLIGCPACIHVEVTKFSAFNLASRMGRPENPKLFYRDSIDMQQLPACQLFAVISATSGSSSWEAMARRIWQEGAELGADLIILQQGDKVYAGSVGNYWGFGVTTTQPVYHDLLFGGCFKIPAGRLGLFSDETGMIIVLTEGGHAREAGLLEGDKILSMDGVPWDKSQNSGLPTKLLGLRPDQVVNLVCVRPGTGRLEGKVKCIPNPPVHLNLPDVFPWNPPEVDVSDYDSRWRPGRRQ
jgi:hypothetical protein